VLDNSVAMRWCFAPATDLYADAVLRRLTAGARATAPVVWLYGGLIDAFQSNAWRE
jgi:hypothetical protein